MQCIKEKEKKIYMKYQREDGLRRLMINKGINPNYVFGRRPCRRRRMQRGAGFMDVVKTVGRIRGENHFKSHS